MNVMPRASQWDELIRPDRVHGSLYSDPAIFEAELQNIWYRTWVYVGHESEVPNANDYAVKSIGPQSVIMTRDEQGKVSPNRGDSQRSASPVLGSVMEQFSKLRQQRSMNRPNPKTR